MERTIFVKEIILATKGILLCPKCNKQDRLESNIVIEARSNGDTMLCTRCEALVITTMLNLKHVELRSQGNTIMLKEPYAIRRISY